MAPFRLSISAFSILLGASLQCYAQGQDSSLKFQLTQFYSLKPGFQDSVLEVAMQTFEKGDESIFPYLLDLAPKSDGYVSESLGSCFGNVLLTKPEFFIRSISQRSTEEMQLIAWLAFTMDGGGMPQSDYAIAKSKLDSLNSVANLYKKAIGVCLRALKEVKEK